MKNADAKVLFLEFFMTINNGPKLICPVTRQENILWEQGTRLTGTGKRNCRREIALPPRGKAGNSVFQKHQARAAQGAAKKAASGLEGNTQGER
ncbi:hypothetical protein [Succinimonas sp.]|uniref:hypothetical protein n=1 Tax=Succinimonas sp. TaxID=1936151 RepID=UPI003867BA70